MNYCSIFGIRVFGIIAIPVCFISFFISFLHFTCPQAQSQVSISLGMQEIYDNNIYLESDKPIPVSILETALDNKELSQSTLKEFDGRLNDDFISNPTITLATAVPVIPHFDTALEGQLGGYFFADQTDQNRVTVDGTLKITTKDTLIPKPFFAELRDHLSSASEDIAVSGGATARQSESNGVDASLGVRDWEFFSKTLLSTYYTFSRHDFLGRFLFNPVNDGHRDDAGTDYTSNGAEATLLRHFTEQLDGHLRGSVTYRDFTSRDSGDLATGMPANQLDRTDSSAATGFAYKISDQVALNGEVGVSTSRYAEKPEPRFVTVVNSDGSLSEMPIQRDSTENSFDFDVGASYTPQAGTTFEADAGQTSLINIDGQRLLVRRFTVNGSRKIGERFELSASGQVTQFDAGTSFGRSNDRLELTTAVHYALTPAIALSVGYNFANQNTQNDTLDNVFNHANDYQVHRVFISLSAGLVGVKG